MGKECTTAHLLRDCQMFKKKTAKDKMDHVMVSNKCFHLLKEEPQVSRLQITGQMRGGKLPKET
jgi:hypothetical protein